MRIAVLALSVMTVMGVLAAPAAAAQERRTGTENARITREELAVSGAANAFDLIRTQRPFWLRGRGAATLRGQRIANPDPSRGDGVTVPAEAEIMIYVDGIRLGNQHVLRQLSLAEIETIEYLDRSVATTRFGTGHTHGAILVTRIK